MQHYVFWISQLFLSPSKLHGCMLTLSVLTRIFWNCMLSPPFWESDWHRPTKLSQKQNIWNDDWMWKQLFKEFHYAEHSYATWKVFEENIYPHLCQHRPAWKAVAWMWSCIVWAPLHNYNLIINCLLSKFCLPYFLVRKGVPSIDNDVVLWWWDKSGMQPWTLWPKDLTPWW